MNVAVFSFIFYLSFSLLFLRLLMNTSLVAQLPSDVLYASATWQSERKKKTSLRVFKQAVRIAFAETRREANALCVSSARYRPRKFLTFCLNDCFAALLKSSSSFASCEAPADECHSASAAVRRLGDKPPYHFRSRGTRDPTVAATGGRPSGPPMYASLLFLPFSFHFQFAI